MKIKYIYILLFIHVNVQSYSADPTNFSMVSPNGTLSVKIELRDKIYYSLAWDKRQIIDPSPISMELMDGTVWEKDPIVRRNKSQNVNELLAPLYGKRKTSVIILMNLRSYLREIIR